MDAVAKQVLETIQNSHLATGADFSVYNKSVDFDTAEFAGALDVMDFAMVRGSSGRADGTVYVDPNLDVYYAELVQHPQIVRDIYHYLSSESKWTKQYGYLLQAMDGKDFDIITLDGERIYNVKSEEFAGYAYYFLKQLKLDFPTKRVKFYSNRYDYMGWFQGPYNFDEFDYHHAQYPWARWDNVNAYYLQQFYAFLNGVFTNQTAEPNLPDSRKGKPNDYVMWQVGAYTGIGLELGFGADWLDINVSKLPLEDFRQWAGLYNRWRPEGTEPVPESEPIEETWQTAVDRRLSALELSEFGEVRV